MNSSSAGYLNPSSTNGLPRGLSLTQFIQTVFVGLSEIPGTLVRPRYQAKPPNQPDQNTNWVAFGIQSSTPDSNAYVNTNPDNSYSLMRQETLEVAVSFYGPNAYDTYCLVRDGFQISQNTAALKAAQMGYVDITQALRVPDLVGEIWVDRYECSVTFHKVTNRTYPVLTFVSASGVIHTVVGNEDYLIDWQTNT